MRVLSALFAAILLIAGFGPSAAAQENPRVIRFGFSGVGTGDRPITGGSAIALVKIKGWLEEEFKDDGIEIQWNYFKGAGPAANEALANKLLDFISQGDLPSLVARASGLRTRIILPQSRNSRPIIAVPEDSPARKFEDLKGKRIAFPKGTASQLTFARILEQHGLTEKDFKTINMSLNALTAALATKDVDAALVGADVYPLIDRGVARILYQGDTSVASTGHVLVTEEFEQKYPQIVQRVVNVVIRAQAWATDEKNRDELFQAWAKSGTAFSSYKRDYEGQTLQTRQSPLFDEFFYQHYRDSLALAKRANLVRADVDIDAWFEPRYVKAALQEQNLLSYFQPQDASGQPVATGVGAGPAGAVEAAAQGAR